MTLTIRDLFTSPDHFLHSFDGAEAIFVPMDRASYARSIFLDDRIETAAAGHMRVPIALLLDNLPDEGEACGWIFHVAHCGSTLLARSLDEIGGGLVLREPLALRQAAVARDPMLLRLVRAMLAKRYPGEGLPLVKANVPVNFTLSDLLGAHPHDPAIALYFGLEDYCLAVLRSDNHRSWLRRVSNELSPVLHLPDDASDGVRLAVLWLAQIRRFVAMLHSRERCAVLNAEDFFAKPEASLGKAAPLFGRACDGPAIADTVNGPLFSHYAKNPGIAFDNRERVTRREELMQSLQHDLGEARTWVRDHAPELQALEAELAARSLI